MTEKEKPLLIQIDDVVREMTPEEIKEYKNLLALSVSLEQEAPIE
jgi:hypothetical protein